MKTVTKMCDTVSRPETPAGDRGLACRLCSHAEAYGWWGDPAITHCRDCHRTWPRTSRETHCAACHRHFGGVAGFDRHFAPGGEHRDPPANQDYVLVSSPSGPLWVKAGVHQLLVSAEPDGDSDPSSSLPVSGTGPATDAPDTALGSALVAMEVTNGGRR